MKNDKNPRNRYKMLKKKNISKHKIAKNDFQSPNKLTFKFSLLFG